MGKRGFKPSYQKTMNGYFQKDPSGQKRTSQSGMVFAWVPVTDPAAIDANATVAVLGVAEDFAGDVSKQRHRWSEFHKCIAKDFYVLCVNGGPLDADFMKKSAADALYGAKLAEKDKKDRRTTVINLTQYLDPEYWKWTDDELSAIKSDDTKAVGEVIVKRLADAGLELICAYIIRHDQDSREVWDWVTESYITDMKPAHVHFLGKVKNGRLLPQFADIIGVEPEFLVYPERGKYAFDNPLSYLIHIKDEDKHLYDPHDVVTLVGDDYLDIYARKKKEWEKGRANKAKRQIAVRDLNYFLDRIRLGDIRTVAQLLLDDEGARVYSRHRKACDDAFKLQQDVHQMKEAEAFSRGEYRMRTAFIYGKSGTGKSVLQNAIASELSRLFGWSIGKGAAKHATEQWHGEEILILDDADGDGMEPTLMKHFFDPNHANPIDERFHGRPEGKPRVLIISSEYGPNAFFVPAATNGNMDISQFLRRAGTVAEVLQFELYEGYNCRVMEPAEVAPYAMTTERLVTRTVEQPDGTKSHEQYYEKYRFEKVTFQMVTPNHLLINGEDPAYTPWGYAEHVIRTVDAANGGRIAARSDADAIFHSVWQHVYEAMCVMPVSLPADIESMPAAIPVSQTRPALVAAEAERRTLERREREAEAKRLEAARRAADERRAAEEYAASRDGRIERMRSVLGSLSVADRNDEILGVLVAFSGSEKIANCIVRRCEVFKRAMSEYEDQRRAYALVKDAVRAGVDSSVLDAIEEPVEPCPHDYIDRIDLLKEMPEKMSKYVLDPQTIERIAEPEKFEKSYGGGYGDFRIYDYYYTQYKDFVRWCYGEPLPYEREVKPLDEPYLGRPDASRNVVEEPDDEFDPADLYS